MARTELHDYTHCLQGEACEPCKYHEKQEKILELLKTRRITVAGKQAVIQMLKETSAK